MSNDIFLELPFNTFCRVYAPIGGQEIIGRAGYIKLADDMLSYPKTGEKRLQSLTNTEFFCLLSANV